MPPRKPATRRKKVAARSKGLSAAETAAAAPDLGELASAVEQDEGSVLARYRDPVGGTPLLLVSLPIERVEPTPYQRDPSDPHVKRLMGVIEKIGMLPRSDHRGAAGRRPTGRRTATIGCRR